MDQAAGAMTRPVEDHHAAPPPRRPTQAMASRPVAHLSSADQVANEKQALQQDAPRPTLHPLGTMPYGDGASDVTQQRPDWQHASKSLQPLRGSAEALLPVADPSQPQDNAAARPESKRASLLPQPLDRSSLDRAASVLRDPHGTSHDGGMAILSSHETDHAPSYSDLFFDLLFAACLNTYSNAVSLQKLGDVAAFMGYFGALWWAWWSQAYFDVRHRRPSHHQPFLFKSCQRIVRAAVLGLWVAFATTPSEFARGSFTNFSQIYGYSRIALALDYAVVLVWDLVHWRKRSHVAHPASLEGDRDNADESGLLAPPPFNAEAMNAGNNDIARIVQTRVLSIASLVASGLLWILSRFVRHNGVTAPLLVMWILGVALKAAVQMVNELGGVLSPLGSSVLPERLVLFGLIVLGEGFTGISETLNKMSPGAKLRNEASGGVAIESGGWSADTILQAASCVLIVILQFGGYFHRATSRIDLSSVLIVLWAYIHVVLHMASALLVIGLKKILSFMNTLNALQRFFDDPTVYLPNSPPWSNLTPDQVAQPFNDEDGSSPLSTNGTLAGISAIISVIQSNDGANIPNLSDAQRLVASVVGLAGGQDAAEQLATLENTTQATNRLSSQFAPSLTLPFKSYFEFADNVINPDSIDHFITNSLFQFKYIYVASAVYLSVDIVIKTMQSSRNRQLRSFRWAMVLRFVFAVVLVLLQVVFTVFDGVPSDAALDGALAICAAVLLAELLAQQLIDALRPRLDRPRSATRKSLMSRFRIRKRSRGPSDSSSPFAASGNDDDDDDDADEMIEMEAQPSAAMSTNTLRPIG